VSGFAANLELLLKALVKTHCAFHSLRNLVLPQLQVRSGAVCMLLAGEMVAAV
jgi:hypothetical protein